MVRAQAETRLQSTATAKGRGVRAAEESGNLRSIGQQRPQAVNGLTGKSEMVPWCRCGRNCDKIAIAVAIAIATFEIAILSKFRLLVCIVDLLEMFPIVEGQFVRTVVPIATRL